MEGIAIGEYVLATKYSDGDPGDHWGVGFYDGERNGRHYVKDGNGEQIRVGGFRAAAPISHDVGRWLLSNAAVLESSPPGVVSLWGMLSITPNSRASTFYHPITSPPLARESGVCSGGVEVMRQPFQV